MKKIELNAPLRFVLIVLIWLLTFTVVNTATATLTNGGVGLIGTLVLYAGMLFLAFCYFEDCALKKAAKTSLLVMVILAVIFLFIQCYGYALDAFRVTNEDAIKLEGTFTNLYAIGRNVTIAICLLVTIVNACNAETAECSCCKKEEKAEKAETKEVAKKEEAKEEVKEEKKDEE